MPGGPPGPCGYPYEGATGGVSLRGAPGPCGEWGLSTAGAAAVRGSWLPPDIRAVLAFGGGVPGSPTSVSGGANTVAGSGTERSSPASALVSVPAHGVASAGTPGAPAP